MNCKCNRCGKNDDRIFSKPKKTPMFKNIQGHCWNGFICPACNLKSKANRRRSSGIPTRENVKEPRWEKAVRAEKLVADWLRLNGYAVTQTNGDGPDLICSNGSYKFTVEVKNAIKKNNPPCWYSGAITKPRRLDDMIAIVLPNDVVYFDRMDLFLKQAGNNGARGITDIVRRNA